MAKYNFQSTELKKYNMGGRVNFYVVAVEILVSVEFFLGNNCSFSSSDIMIKRLIAALLLICSL